MSGSPRDALDRLVEPFDSEAGDWGDVVRRARHRRLPHKLALTAAFIVLVLVLAVPLGLAGQVIGLFKDEGKPVPVASLSRADRSVLILMMCGRVELVAPPGKSPEKRCADGEPTITEVGNDGVRRYWKVSYPNGVRCLASGRVRGYRQIGGGRSSIGQMGCGKDPNLFPNPRRPITVDEAIGFEAGDRQAHLFRASGLAGEGVAEVGLVDANGKALKTEVKGRTYTFDRPPERRWESIVAYDESGDQVYRESLHLDVGPRPPAVRRRPAKPPPPRPLPPLPKQPPFQHGEAPGATIDVYRSGFVAVHVDPRSRAYDLLRPRSGSDRSTGITCARFAYGAGRWESLAWGAGADFGPEIRGAISGPARARGRGEMPRPPFDACWLKGRYGLRWNDARGMHAAVEVGFTPLGRRFFDESAVVNDLALFIRTPQMRSVRAAMRDGRIPSGSRIASMFPSRVVGLDERTESAPRGTIGVWSNGRDLLIISRVAEDGRRIYVTLRKGAFGPNNFAGLKRLFY